MGTIRIGTDERVEHRQEFGFGYVKFEMSMRHTVKFLVGQWILLHGMPGRGVTRS